MYMCMHEQKDYIYVWTKSLLLRRQAFMDVDVIYGENIDKE